MVAEGLRWRRGERNAERERGVRDPKVPERSIERGYVIYIVGGEREISSEARRGQRGRRRYEAGSEARVRGRQRHVCRVGGRKRLHGIHAAMHACRAGRMKEIKERRQRR